MRDWTKWLCVLLLVLAGSTLQAQNDEDPCDGEDQTNMNLCAKQRYDASDAQLNVTWKALLTHLDKATKAKLVVVERDWIKFRDGQCACEASGFEGGSMQPLIHFGCMRRLTEERIGHLQNMLESYDN